MNTANITTVVFDLDDTLRTNTPHAHDFFCDYVELLGHPLSNEQRRLAHLWEHRYWASSTELNQDLDTFGREEGFWLNYSRRHLAALGFSPKELDELAPLTHVHMNENYQPSSQLRPETLPILEQLSSADLSLGVITNRSRPIHAEMGELDLDWRFDFYLTGVQLDAYKPNKEIFEKLLDFIGQAPGQVLYVGDNYYADIIGARNAGLENILLNWKGLYISPDCEAIQTLAELPAVLHLNPVS